MSGPAPRQEQVLSKQLAMNQATWRTLQQHGISEDADLRLDFTYIAAGEKEAEDLTALLRRETDYEVRMMSSGGGLLKKKRWTVSGTTQPTSVNLDILNQWVTWMVVKGFEMGCEFDGWGTQVPSPNS
jgi:hypothetical protein